MYPLPFLGSCPRVSVLTKCEKRVFTWNFVELDTWGTVRLNWVQGFEKCPGAPTCGQFVINISLCTIATTIVYLIKTRGEGATSRTIAVLNVTT